METITTTEKSRKGYILLFVVIIIAVSFVILYTFTAKNFSVPTVQNGDNVSVFYSLKYTNGTLIQSNFNKTPFSFIAGSNGVISGFNSAVAGMKIGQSKTVTIPPSEAYGNVSSSLIITVPRSDFGNSSISDGQPVGSSSGQTGAIVPFNSTNVTVNFNSPLAGETLVFHIKVVGIKKA